VESSQLLLQNAFSWLEEEAKLQRDDVNWGKSQVSKWIRSLSLVIRESKGGEGGGNKCWVWWC
jgi:hypothetical protein